MPVGNAPCAIVNVSAAVKGCDREGDHVLEDDDVDVNDRLCGESRYGGATNVLNGKDWNREKVFLKRGFGLGERGRPLWVVVFNDDAHIFNPLGFCGVAMEGYIGLIFGALRDGNDRRFERILKIRSGLLQTNNDSQ